MVDEDEQGVSFNITSVVNSTSNKVTFKENYQKGMSGNKTRLIHKIDSETHGQYSVSIQIASNYDAHHHI